jgi:hypothetical protein
VTAIPAPPGTVTYNFTVFDRSNGAGNAVSEVISALTFTSGVSNTPSVTMQGVPARVTVSGAAPSANIPLTNQPLTVTVADADNNTIVSGTYFTPVTLTDGDATAQTTIAKNGGTGGTSVTLSGAAEASAVTLAYTGQATNPIPITASGTGVTGGGTIATSVNDISVTGTTICNASAGCASTAPDYGLPTVFFGATSAGAQTLTAAELGWSNAPYNQKFTLTLDPATCGSGASQVVQSPANPATSWSITPQAVGICKATLAESLPVSYGGTFPTHGATSTKIVYLSVTSNSFTVQSTDRKGR